MSGVISGRAKALLGMHSRHGRELVLVAFGQLMAAVGTVVGLRVLTGLLSPQQFGEYTLGLTVSTLVGMLASGPGLAATRFFSHAVECHQFQSYFQASWKVLLQRIKIVSGLITFLLAAVWMMGHGRWIGMILATIIASLAIAFSSIFDGIQSAARQRAVVALHSGMIQWLRFIIAFFLIWFFGSSSTAAMFGYCLAAMCVLMSQFLFFRLFERKLGSDQQPVHRAAVQSWQQRLSDYAWPVALYGGFDWVNQNVGRWALQIFVDTKNVGLHSALAQLGSGPMLMASNLVTQLFGPILFSRAGDGLDHTRRHKATNLNARILFSFLLFSMLIVIFTFLFHRYIFMIFVASEYRGVSGLLPIVMISGALSACGNIALFFILSGSETKSLVMPKALIMALGLLCNSLGAYWFGLVGIIWTGVIMSFLYLGSILYISLLRYRDGARQAHESNG